MNADQRLAATGLTLPSPAIPVGAYLPLRQIGNLVFLAGHGPKRSDGTFVTGKVGRDLDVKEARDAARLAGGTLLATLHDWFGGLARISGVVKLVGMVNTVPEFSEIPAVLDGCSDLLIEVFGESGRHTRVALGVTALPLDIPVEVEAIVTVME